MPGRRLVNLGLFAWALSAGRAPAEAMTLTFVSLVLIQFVKAYNFRSDRRHVFDAAVRQPVAEPRGRVGARRCCWLIIYVPLLHEPFGTFALSLQDWILILGLALTVVPVLELSKWMERRGWLREASIAPSPQAT